MPFIAALGYDVFNPLEVLPEMSCDIGKKKGEKIDYAIIANNEPVILIECKHWAQNLNLHDPIVALLHGVKGKVRGAHQWYHLSFLYRPGRNE